jgi:hypothetical protein
MPETKEEDLQGFKYFEKVKSLLECLHGVREHPGRVLHFDQYLALLLFYFFNPVLTSLRGLERALHFEKVQRTIGVPRVALSTLSEAGSVFPVEYVEDVIRELSSQISLGDKDPRLRQLTRELTAVDGTFMHAAPRITWALWESDRSHAAKIHVQLEVLSGRFLRADVTAGTESETRVLRRNLESGRVYILDRGYVNYELYRRILDAGSSLVARIDARSRFHTDKERAITEEDRKAGVVSDREGYLGHPQSPVVLDQGPLRIRLVEVSGSSQRDKESVVRIATDLWDVPADVIALIFRYRWQIELFFRWLKCVLGFQKLICESENGVNLQVYAAIIATMLITLWTQKKPTKAVFEAVVFHLQGWASLEELKAVIASQKTPI